MDAASSGNTSSFAPRDDDPGAGWLRQAAGLVVAALAGLSIASAYVESAFFPMPSSHLVMVPIAAALMATAWLLELLRLRWPRWAFAAVVTAPNLWLALAGHSLVNLLFQMLLAGWLGAREPTRWGRAVGLAITLSPILVSAALDATDGLISITAWSSWTAGVGAMWVMGYTLAAQRQLVRRLQEAQAAIARQTREGERLRLARDMHDSASQSIYTARLFSEAALRALAAGDTVSATERLKDTRDAIRNAAAELRVLIHDLRPSALEERGLAEALRLRLEAVEGRAGLETELVTEPETLGALPQEIEQELYRLAQESLNNALKHARASRVKVTLRRAQSAVTLEVADDGIGFDQKSAATGGVGLASLRERAARIGGQLRVVTAPGQGTRVIVETPL